MLAVTTRQIAAEPLPGVRVLAFGAETAGSPAAAVLDGAWNTVTAEQMWRHPITQEASILLDLGTERTVAGVRVWNFNEAGGTQRGWKEFAVYVGRTPATMSDPVATGIVAKAPGVVDAPDYSVTLPISFVRGRYVRLEANGFWAKDSHTGLTEVQVLGF